MKRLVILMVLLVIWTAGIAQISSNLVVITPAEHGASGQAILDSIKKEFPAPISQTLSVISAKDYGREWNVQVSNESERLIPNYYEVIVKTKDGWQTAIYDKSGKLLKTKQVIKSASLPEAVQKVLNTRYADWRVTGKEERITSADKFDVTYRINLKKGVLRKTVFLDPDGNIRKALPI